MRVASAVPRSVKSARSFFPVSRLSSLPIWRLVSVISAVSLTQALFQSLNLGQERLPTGLRCLKLQQPLLCHTLLGLQGLKTG